MLTDGLGLRLRGLREIAEISARELGELAKLDPSYPAQIERGEKKAVGVEPIAQLARVLGVTTDFLVLGRGRAPTKRVVMAAVEAARALRGAA